MVIRDRSAAGLTDRGRVLVFAAVSGVMLASSVTIRLSTPSPLAPRVHVRWANDVSDGVRGQLEARFGLVAARHREGSTWEYDLSEPSASTIHALLNHPAVADTHYIDRSSGTLVPDAPRGTTLLARRPMSRWVHSPLFDWFIAFWISSFVVSWVWLAPSSDRESR
jgi:hypothetical protein